MFLNLQAKFDGRVELPIEVQDICDALVELGYQDDIRVVPEEMDLNQLLGAYVQWREPNGMYGEPKWVSLIVYPSNHPDTMMQRIICAKELVHVCDSAAAKTKDPDEIVELARVLSEKIPPEETQITRLKVAKDVLAQGQALMLLFPKAARLICRQKFSDGEMTIEDLVDIIQLPEKIVVEMLDPDWEIIADALGRI